MSDDRYEVITWRGHRFDRYTVAAIQAAEKMLGYELDVVQGSYNAGGVALSAGTHDGGGAVDFRIGPMPVREVRALRTIGFAAWHRTPREGPWGDHIHAILIGNEKASAGAKRQVESYRDGRNGLAGNTRDTTWRPNPIPTFNYEEDDDMPSAEEIAKAILKTKIRTDDAPEGRYVDSILQKLYNDAYPAKKG